MAQEQKQYQVMHWLNNGMFPGFVMFSCGFSYDEIMAELKEKENTEDWILGLSGDKVLIDKGKWFGLRRDLENTKTGESKTLFYIILVDCYDFEDDDHYCKLAHEIVHICQFYLPDILDRDREIEAEAYYHTHLMRQCLKVLRGKVE